MGTLGASGSRRKEYQRAHLNALARWSARCQRVLERGILVAPMRAIDHQRRLNL